MQIVRVPNAVLTSPAQTVTAVDKKLLTLIEEMKKTLVVTDNPKGVGLAAPQVDRSIRVFLTKPTPKTPFGVFINPEIIWQSQELTDGVPERDKKFEGCLSIPNVWGMVHRAKKIKLRYQLPSTINHELITKERTFSGFLATIIQHEVDHLNGILFTQRVLEQKARLPSPDGEATGGQGKLYKITGRDEKGNDVFEEIEL